MSVSDLAEKFEAKLTKQALEPVSSDKAKLEHSLLVRALSELNDLGYAVTWDDTMSQESKTSYKNKINHIHATLAEVITAITRSNG